MVKHNLKTRSARRVISGRPDPYWRPIVKGRALGYRKRKKGGTWIARFIDDQGKKHYKALGIADDALPADAVRGDKPILDFEGALEEAGKWFAYASSGDMGVRSDLLTIGDMLDEYIKWFLINRKSGNETVNAIEANIRPALGDIPLKKISKKRLTDWLVDLGNRTQVTRIYHGKITVVNYKTTPRKRKSTANRNLAVLIAALNHCFNEIERPDDVWFHAQRQWRAVKAFKGVNDQRVEFMSLDELKRLINVTSGPLRHLVTAASLTGARYGELGHLTNRDFNGHSVYIAKSKTGKDRYIPLHKEGREFFAALTAGKPQNDRMLYRDGVSKTWNKGNQTKPMREAYKAANITPMGIHALRHTYATQMLMAGMADVTLAKLLGHSSTEMIHRHYGHITGTHLAEKVDEYMPTVGAIIDDKVIRFQQAS